LIQSCYRRAGLDLNLRQDRPQYFEAHGTGTQAGDPVEAEAISTSFFGDLSPDGQETGETPLLVGSIKTVVGHTEGTAGLAAIMKTSLALQHGEVVPNLLFESLNPKIRPFYANLKVPTATQPWPTVEEGQPRRASVNRYVYDLKQMGKGACGFGPQIWVYGQNVQTCTPLIFAHFHSPIFTKDDLLGVIEQRSMHVEVY
jgi:acyl transferase domain-containing protein